MLYGYRVYVRKADGCMVQMDMYVLYTSTYTLHRYHTLRCGITKLHILAQYILLLKQIKYIECNPEKCSTMMMIGIYYYYYIPPLSSLLSLSCNVCDASTRDETQRRLPPLLPPCKPVLTTPGE